ncbi:hypothetical protein SDC9_83750 [bioreactor metagenome]|uniref:Uncharacterized protein n=1 Tax=bioreactor metagenome TaxID=1076179 RepID=A0A644ZH38_9ZZZZ
MPIASDDLRLFGLDLRNVWHELKTPWGKLVDTSAWSWLAPRVAIRVTGEDGQSASVWKADPATRGFRRVEEEAASGASDGKSAGREKIYEAVLVPESLLLRKRLSMPQLDGDQMQRAVALEAMNSSPFPSGDLLWGYALNPTVPATTAGLVTVDMVVASRSRAEQYLSQLADFSDVAKAPEVWALLPRRADAAMLLPGFGEARRASGSRKYWTLLGVLAAVVVALLIAIAVTPYLQLRARVMQANLAYAALDQRAAPQLAKREALIKAEGEVTALGEIIGHRLDTLQVIQALTNALPDDTVLQRLQIEGRKVAIAGNTADSAALMQKLGALPQVREVRAPSAAVRRPGMATESFQIEFQLSDDFGVSAGDAAVAAALAPASAASDAATPASAPASAPLAAASAASAALAAASAPTPVTAPVKPTSSVAPSASGVSPAQSTTGGAR